MTSLRRHAHGLLSWVWLALMLPLMACSTSTPVSEPPLNVTPMSIAPIANSLVCPQGNSSTRAGTFVRSDGQRLLYDQQPLKLTGYTFYPGDGGGTEAWHTQGFSAYIDHILDMGVQAGQNLIRPTDFWGNNIPDQTVDDPIIWQNLDFAVCAAKQRGMFVIMDVSAFRWLLASQGHDVYDIQAWESFLVAVANHYRDEPAIAFYSIFGEPDIPQTPEASQQLVAFYRSLTDTLHAADRHHLISAGGFNHMEDETPQQPWWHQIYALPHNDIAGFKTYSQDDLDLMSTIAKYTTSIHKPLFEEEFGMPQSQGDDAFAGGSGYNQIFTGRAAFFDTVYRAGESLKLAGFVFWNMGCQIAPTSYEVSALTPATWQMIIRHAANAPEPMGSTCGEEGPASVFSPSLSTTSPHAVLCEIGCKILKSFNKQQNRNRIQYPSSACGGSRDVTGASHVKRI